MWRQTVKAGLRDVEAGNNCEWRLSQADKRQPPISGKKSSKRFCVCVRARAAMRLCYIFLVTCAAHVLCSAPSEQLTIKNVIYTVR